MKKLLAIVDNWEKLDIYEEKLVPYFSVGCAPFGDYGIQMALEDKPDVILLNLAFENMTLSEATALIRGQESLRDIPLLLIDEVGEPLSVTLSEREQLLPGTSSLEDVLNQLNRLVSLEYSSER
jgi:CheY-like chemotaxis protein